MKGLICIPSTIITMGHSIVEHARLHRKKASHAPRVYAILFKKTKKDKRRN